MIHRLAAERVALQFAVDKNSPELAPKPILRDAIALVRLGRLVGNPAFFCDDNQPDFAEPRDLNDKLNYSFVDAYSVVGELVLMATALDHQLNHVLIGVLHLTDSPMLESVIATLDMNRKLEMLKARAKHIAPQNWRKALISYLDKLESISKWRNIACHTVLIPDEKFGAIFAPTAAAKLLKALRLGDEPTTQKIPISDLRPQIKSGEFALAEGQNLISNFIRMNQERAKRFGRK